MSDKTKKRLLIGAAIVAAILFLLFSRGGQIVTGGSLPSVAGPGGITLNGPQIPGVRDINIPPPWTPPSRPCRCGCDDYGSHSGNFALMSMPPESMAAMMGVF